MTADEPLLGALGKVERRRLQPEEERESFTDDELAALKQWLAQFALADLMRPKTRADRSERNKAEWIAGDRSRWGGDRRKRDKRRGWRNFSG